MSPGHWPRARGDGTTSVENQVWVPVQNAPPVHLDGSQPLELLIGYTSFLAQGPTKRSACV